MSVKKFFKKMTGIQAIEDRKEAKFTRERAEELYELSKNKTEQLRDRLNNAITAFGRLRLESVAKTLKQFVYYLKDLRQKSKLSECDLIDIIDIKQEQLKELEDLEMSASQIMKGTLTASAVGAIALTGVPTAITSAVTAFATASTGTAISSLSGVAATNAVLAWLGGGSLAAGGGGMAGGAAVLSAATWTATGGLAVLTAGLIASAHYSKKLTEAKEFEKNVEIAVAKMEKTWIVMDGIEKRVHELQEVTNELTVRTIIELRYLAPLAPDFDNNDNYHLSVFQKCGILAKSVGELAKTPIFNEEGDISEESGIIVRNIRNLLTT